MVAMDLKMKLFTFMNRVFMLVFIYVYLDYYIKTIDDMQNGMDFDDHYNEFEYNHDYVIFLGKIDDAKEVHLI